MASWLGYLEPKVYITGQISSRPTRRGQPKRLNFGGDLVWEISSISEKSRLVNYYNLARTIYIYYIYCICF